MKTRYSLSYQINSFINLFRPRDDREVYDFHTRVYVGTRSLDFARMLRFAFRDCKPKLVNFTIIESGTSHQLADFALLLNVNNTHIPKVVQQWLVKFEDCCTTFGMSFELNVDYTKGINSETENYVIFASDSNDEIRKLLDRVSCSNSKGEISVGKKLFIFKMLNEEETDRVIDAAILEENVDED